MRTSPSSSSTSSTSITLTSSNSVIGFLVVTQQGFGCFLGSCSRRSGVLVRGGLIHRLGWHGQCEQEPRAFRIARVEPGPAAEILGYPPGHGQADAGARVGAPL